ncbi:uncharacterized protein LOC103279440 isoform X2 [Anolis carolinensis]|uniref:uncharacterized protein LOC103279440 isoform X2 n=1 Tax=Anolis carolinensis TaxID=28377 RepID=UPI002F2B84B2
MGPLLKDRITMGITLLHLVHQEDLDALQLSHQAATPLEVLMGITRSTSITRNISITRNTSMATAMATATAIMAKSMEAAPAVAAPIQIEDVLFCAQVEPSFQALSSTSGYN